MSVQFGRWNFDHKPIEQDYFDKARQLLAPFGPDGVGSYSNGNMGVIYCAFHTTVESNSEKQPYSSASGAVITWDGRLDNRTELISELRETTRSDPTDIEIVAAAYERWQHRCFARLIGDWALAIWNPSTSTVTLAKDPIGIRQLYYSFNAEYAIWSTVLDPIILFADKQLTLSEEYIAGWFSFYPAAHLTPYVGVHSVAPSSSVVLQPGKHRVSTFWQFDPAKRIRYRSDAEYEEHFRSVFRESVRRRLRSSYPVLAELSGGMDSSSIVCIADEIIKAGDASTPRLDTVSYYDDSEPNWNERPFFTKVEAKRGRTGSHIDVCKQELYSFPFNTNEFMATPDSMVRHNNASRQVAEIIKAQDNRVVLSGIGGDEVMGGVPTPTPELEDLLARGHFRKLAHQLKLWALSTRRPWFYLLYEAIRRFLPHFLYSVPQHHRPLPWLTPAFVKRNRLALRGYESRLTLFGALPSFQENLETLDVLRRQLGCVTLPSNPTYHKCYPYLDRTLLEFAYAIPREQLVRPGQRRSLMRRALAGIVPEELLNRKRKAFIARAPLVRLSAELTPRLDELRQMVSSSLGIICEDHFHNTITTLTSASEIRIVPLTRALGIEQWLRSLNYRAQLTRDNCT